MSFESDFRTLLLADGTIAGIVSARVYPDIFPQGATFPGIVYQRISGVRDYTLAGPDGLCVARMQVTCWSTTRAASKSLAEAVRKCLAGYSGTMTSTVVQFVRQLDEIDGFESDPELYRTDADYEVYYEETP